MSTPRDDRPADRRDRPGDPAGTQPKHDPEALLPARPLRPPSRGEGVVEGHAIEDGQEPAPVDDGDLLPERRAAGRLGAVAAPKAPPPHASRFHFLYGAIAALAVAIVAGGVLAVVASRDNAANHRKLLSWSTWHPNANDPVAGAGEIGDHVGRQYRLPDGRQLVTVGASGMDFEGIPLSVAIRESAAQGGDIRVFSDNGLIYRLCGLGANCAIGAGKPSQERHLLLRREALELALYSFRYLDKINQVAVLMPPPPGKPPTEAVFFRRGDVAPQLSRPLTASLSRRTPGVSTIERSSDATLVDRLTNLHQFTFTLTRANTENRGFLVLDPVDVASK